MCRGSTVRDLCLYFCLRPSDAWFVSIFSLPFFFRFSSFFPLPTAIRSEFWARVSGHVKIVAVCLTVLRTWFITVGKMRRLDTVMAKSSSCVMLSEQRAVVRVYTQCSCSTLAFLINMGGSRWMPVHSKGFVIDLRLGDAISFAVCSFETISLGDYRCIKDLICLLGKRSQFVARKVLCIDEIIWFTVKMKYEIIEGNISAWNINIL